MLHILLGSPRFLLVVLVVVSLCTLDSADAFVDPGPERNLADKPTKSAFQPSAAWIRSANFSEGLALVAYSVGDPEKAAWSASQATWATGTPGWHSAHAWDDPGVRWPDPENFCDLYACENGAKWKSYDRAVQALWTGLDDVAAIVAVGHDDAKTPSNSVVVLTSLDGGVSFKHASIISLSTHDGDSGFEIDPDSVHASLMYTPERSNSSAGKVAIPIYVIWRNSYLGESWWMTKVTVGFNGGVSLQSKPKKVTAIAGSVHGHASILAFQDDDLGEVVEIAWSERLDANGKPAWGPSCPSMETIGVKWWLTWSRDFGDTWDRPTLVDEDKAWRPCVGPSFAAPGAPKFGVNNDRPEFVMNRGRGGIPPIGPIPLGVSNPYRWYMAINKTVNGKSCVLVRRFPVLPIPFWPIPPPDPPGPVGTGMGSHVIYISSPVQDFLTNSKVKDSWGQALAIHQGNKDVRGDVVVIYRNANEQNQISMAAASSTDWGISWTAEALGTATWSMTDRLGLYNGLTVLEACINRPCPDGPLGPPKVPFLAACGRITEAQETSPRSGSESSCPNELRDFRLSRDKTRLFLWRRCAEFSAAQRSI
jgi:hypothetical protein